MRHGRAILTYARDRSLLPLTALRLMLCIAIVAADPPVPVPTSDVSLALESFLSLAFAVPAALTLPERLQWVAQGRSSVVLRVLRILSCAITDGACLLAIAMTSRMSHHTALTGGPMMVLGIGYAASVFSAKLSWLIAAAFGSIGLLTVNHSPEAIIDSVPTAVGVAVVAAGFAIYAVAGPRVRAGS